MTTTTPPDAVAETSPALSVEWVGHNVPGRWPQSSMQRIYVRARNTGTVDWQADPTGPPAPKLVVRENAQVRETVALPHAVPAGMEVTFSLPFLVGPLVLRRSAQIQLEFSLSTDETLIGDPLVLDVEIGPAEDGASAEALQVFGLVCAPCFVPSGGVTRSRDGRPFPLFARRAVGCVVEDVEGNRWVDYIMGWGAALLGYARPEIRQAIAAQLDSAAVVALPHALELEAAAMLSDMIPCAQTTLFGKNGSDVCTAAVRMARVYTGKPKILFSGYSGWQEPFAGVFEHALNLPDHPPAAFRFPANDLARVTELFKQHAGEVAAVMIEPAAQIEAVDGPVSEQDPHFLDALSRLCQRQGALLIFDEILTGFRHPLGSVQKASGVTPDLACFGKALTSGMPLSVLVGRRDVMSESIRKIFYHPTFKGEAYSFAAAIAALGIYASNDVPTQIASFGERLREEVAVAGKQAGVGGTLIGPPYRMVYRFDEPCLHRRTLMRTLLSQELLKRGVLTFRGFMLPSTAHGNSELEQTAEAYEASLRVVRQVADTGDFERHLEIPPII